MVPPMVVLLSLKWAKRVHLNYSALPSIPAWAPGVSFHPYGWWEIFPLCFLLLSQAQVCKRPGKPDRLTHMLAGGHAHRHRQPSVSSYALKGLVSSSRVFLDRAKD